RESLRRNHFQRTRAALAAWAGRTVRNHQSQRKVERRIAGASANVDRSVEERSKAAPPISLRSTNALAETFLARARLVFAGSGRWRKMAVSQLSGQSALRRAEPVSILHGEHAPAAQPEGLRVLHHAAGRGGPAG